MAAYSLTYWRQRSRIAHWRHNMMWVDSKQIQASSSLALVLLLLFYTFFSTGRFRHSGISMSSRRIFDGLNGNRTGKLNFVSISSATWNTHNANKYILHIFLWSQRSKWLVNVSQWQSEALSKASAKYWKEGRLWKLRKRRIHSVTIKFLNCAHKVTQ
jgi:hypothetical protein